MRKAARPEWRSRLWFDGSGPLVGPGERIMMTSGYPAKAGHPEVVFASADGCESARAHFPETGDDVARIAASELHGIFPQA